MNRFYLVTLHLVTLLVGALALPVAAQQGKPLYELTAYRSDTAIGTITLELFADIAPLHVRNFDSLVAIGFYDGLAFHRVIPNFMIQGGDPNTRSGPESTWGQGDPTQANVPAEFNPISHQRGILSAARADDPNSATSQFFIVHAPATGLDRRYTVYGRVIDGIEIVDTIVSAPKRVANGELARPIDKITMTIRRIGIDTTTPAAPTLLIPPSDTTRIRSQQELRWTAVPDAILYEVQLSRTPDFATIAMKDSVTGTSYMARSLELGLRDYYWRVRASNGGRRGPFSEVRTFRTAIGAAALGAPANNDTTVDAPVLFTWAPVEGAVSYRLQIAPTVGFLTILHDAPGLTDTTLTLGELETNRRLFWRVLAISAAGDTTQSSRWNFSIGAPRASAPTVERIEGVEASVRADADGRIVVELLLGRSAALDIALVDALGRQIDAIGSTVYHPGTTTVTLENETSIAGAYFVRITTADGVGMVRKVVVR